MEWSWILFGRKDEVGLNGPSWCVGGMERDRIGCGDLFRSGENTYKYIIPFGPLDQDLTDVSHLSQSYKFSHLSEPYPTLAATRSCFFFPPHPFFCATPCAACLPMLGDDFGDLGGAPSPCRRPSRVFSSRCSSGYQIHGLASCAVIREMRAMWDGFACQNFPNWAVLDLAGIFP